tara:strand:+ start:76 stop:297 length:222 start_codon:yes stop_codon:yes gene_type:complete
MSKTIKIGDMYVVQFKDRRMYTMVVESYDQKTGQIKGKELVEEATVGSPNGKKGAIILTHVNELKYKITNPWQ